MRSFIASTLAFLVAGLTAQAQKPDTRYKLNYTGKDQVEVELRMKPLEADSTIFNYGMPAFGGQMDLFKAVSGIRGEHASSIRIDESARAIIVHHKGRREFVLHYVITDTHTPAMAVRGESFRPLISPQYFFSHGINIFMVPAFRNKALVSRMSVEWDKPLPFPVFYGYDPAQGEGPIVAPCSEEFLFSPITGATDMSVDTMHMGKSVNYVVLRNYPGNPMTRDAVSSYFRKFYTTINAFWKDPGGSHFSLILHPFLQVNHNISGVAYNTGFVGRYKRDTTFNTDQLFVLSHEIGHHWLGQGLTISMNDQWFGEGFNDYISFVTLHASGLVDQEQFREKMNEAFRKLYASPVRNTPNDSVFANYWKMGDYNRLPYWRGSIFAFWLDNAIRLRSGNRNSIRDLLLDLLPLRKPDDGEQRITREDFLLTAAKYVPEAEVRSAFDRHILNGATISFTQEMLMPFFLIKEDAGIPQLYINDAAAMGRSFPATQNP